MALARSFMSHNAAPRERMLHCLALITGSEWINGEFWGTTVFILLYLNMSTTLCASGLVLHARLHLMFNVVKQFVLFGFHISKSKYEAKQKLKTKNWKMSQWSACLDTPRAEPRGKTCTSQEMPWEHLCIQISRGSISHPIPAHKCLVTFLKKIFIILYPTLN